jgi:hypothetical protein
MKKQLLFALATAFTVSSYAQTNTPDMNGVNIAQPYTKKMIVGNEQGPVNRASGGGNSVAASSNGTVIGGTTYDLQTNGSVQNRLVKHADGTISAVWTYSNAFSIAAPDRGTGYNYYNGTSWGTIPTARIESERGGWPSILPVSGGEVNSLHNTASGPITMNKRATKGTGSWTETNITIPGNSTDLIWNRSAVGGTNGQSIHMIAVTAPVANQGALYQGLDGALVYFRSLDGGITFDQQGVVLPGMTSTDFVGFSGDSYSIMAKGNTIVIAVFEDWADSFIMKSTDNGTTWTKTLFIDFPLDMYVANQAGGSDADGDGNADTLTTTDNSGSLVIDNNGMAHIFYGNMRVLDADLTDAGTTFFPYTNGLKYWNENMPADSAQFIAWAEDLDNNGQVQNSNETAIAQYFTSLASFPNASMDASGSIYVTYSAYMETLSNGDQSYRHIYLVKSDDGGCTWNQFVDMTPNDNFAECIYPSIANVTDDSIRFIYQEDIEPGLAVRGDEDAYGDNDIVYIAVHKNSLNSTTLNCVTWVKGDTAFCPGTNAVFEASCGTAYAWSTGTTTATETITTFGTFTVDITTSCGTTNTHTITTGQPTNPPTVTKNGDQFICGANPATIGVDPVSGGSYLWSTGATTMTTTITTAGTYTVTVTNCGGTSTEMFVMATEPTPANTVNAIGQTTFCEGSGSLVLSAVEGASWLWSNGATTQSITLSTAAESGSYTCDISNSCGDMVTSTTVVVVINPQPAQPTVSYTGNGVYSSSATSGNQWYLDGNIAPGATTQTFDASLYKGSTVTVIVTNSDGCTSETSADAVVGLSEIQNTLNNVKVYPNPNNGLFDINFNAATSATYDVKVTNVIGQTLVTKTVNVSGNMNINMDITSFNKGLYFVTISSQGEDNVYKLIVE